MTRAGSRDPAGEPHGAMPHHWKVLAVPSLAVFAVLLDFTIVSIAFPDIRRSFPGTSLGELSWILSAYAIVFAAFLAAAGRLADRFGRRRFFLSGVAVFLVASAACGAALTAPVLIAMRAVQGVGAAILFPTSLALLLAAFPPRQRATATAIWSAAGAVAAALGPSLGGLLVAALGWRAIFFLNLVIGLPGAARARSLLHESRTPDAPFPDIAGAVVLSVGVGALALGLVEGNAWGWTSERTLLALGSAPLLLGVAVMRSARHRAPILAPALFGIRSFRAASTAYSLFAVGFFSLLFTNALFLTGVWHYSVLHAGVAATPAPLVTAIAAPIGGRLADRHGPRVVAIPGALGFALGTLLYAVTTSPNGSYAREFLPGALVMGVGIGLAVAGFAAGTVAELPRHLYATASAIAAALRQIGAALGIAAVVLVIGGAPHDITGFHRVWVLMTGTSTLAAIVGLLIRPVHSSPAATRTTRSKTLAPDSATPRRLPEGAE
jgi:EmrB/QacA subfamily drug resistance transporter